METPPEVQEVAPIEEVDPSPPKMGVPEVEKLDLETVPDPPVKGE